MFVIPMVGLSSRFFKAGYKKPKYMLDVGGKSLFVRSVESFKNYFISDHFVFVVRSDFQSPEFVAEHAVSMGIKSFEVVVLDSMTKGQADTVALALEKIERPNTEEVYVFNIDTLRPNYLKPQITEYVDGYLETFIGEGSNWSNVKPIHGSDKVMMTAEKKEISEYCCTGLYFWKSASLFLETYRDYYENDRFFNAESERYIAPIYNAAITDGNDIRFTIISQNDVIFCGTPVEYDQVLSTIDTLD